MAEQMEKLRVAQLERMKRKRRRWARGAGSDVKVIESYSISLIGER